MDLSEFIYVFRVIVAGICGIIIGYERKSRAKEAGIRTHFIVASAAALIMIVSKYGFFDLIQQAIAEGVEVKLDPSRIASCIVSGVGFLGAGMIFVQKYTIRGLTTAAGIWATAGIGMAVGAGLYATGILFTAIIYVAQVVLHKDSKLLSVRHLKVIKIKDVDQQGYISELTRRFAVRDIVIDDYDVSRSAESETFEYTITIEIPKDFNEEELLSMIEYNTSLETMR